VEGGAEQVHYISGTVQESWMRERWREELNWLLTRRTSSPRRSWIRAVLPGTIPINFAVYCY
jgi:hypothetical protein